MNYFFDVTNKIINCFYSRIMTVTSADEFYSIMGVLTREMLEFTDTNNLIKVKTIINSLISFKHSLIMIMFPSKDCILF